MARTIPLGRASITFLRLLFGVLLLGCPPAENSEKKASQPAACAKVGQTCEYSPGKLGTCVMKDGCTEAAPTCFVCQSQH